MIQNQIFKHAGFSFFFFVAYSYCNMLFVMVGHSMLRILRLENSNSIMEPLTKGIFFPPAGYFP